MRLLSHNFLLCNVSKCDASNYPLQIIVEKSEHRESPFNNENLGKLIKKIDWLALSKTVNSVTILSCSLEKKTSQRSSSQSIWRTWTS